MAFIDASKVIVYSFGILLIICLSAKAETVPNITVEFKSSDLFEEISDGIHSEGSYQRSLDVADYNLYHYIGYEHPILEFLFTPKYSKFYLTILFMLFGLALNVKNVKSAFQNPTGIIIALLLNVIIFPVLIVCVVSEEIFSILLNKIRFN